MKQVEELLESIIEIRKRYLLERHEKGLDYNVFKIIRKSDDEVNLHTKMLENLLDPNSYHGLNKGPLKLFIELCIPEGERDFINSKVVVTREHQTAYGNIDIVISSKDTIIAIENKINAKDQEDQLNRYLRYLESTSKKSFLIYLTKDGRTATKTSIDPTNENKYLRISYHHHIVRWIEKILNIREIKAFVSEPLKQYLNIVKEFSGVSMIDKEDKELTKLIRKNKFYYNAAFQIYDKFNYIKNEIEDEIKSKIEKGMEKISRKHNFYPDKDDEGNSYICYGKKKKIKFGIWWDGRNIYYGVTTEDKEVYNELKRIYPDEDKHGDDAKLISYDTGCSFDDNLIYENYIENENIISDILKDFETFIDVFISTCQSSP